MKKSAGILAALLLCASLLAGCGTAAQEIQETGTATEKTQEEKDSSTQQAAEVKVAALKGPTAMGMVQFMAQADEGVFTDHSYHFEIVASVDEVTPKIAQGQVDIAAVPANLASVLYNNTKGDVQVLAINTLGVLYIVERGQTVSKIQDLAGKTIYASGKGATPEYALQYILSQNGLQPDKDVTIEWKSEHTECLAALMADENVIAMLPQPFVATAQAKADDIRVALDLTQEWDKVGAESSLLTGVVVVRRDFAEKNPAAVKAFLTHYKESVAFVNAEIESASVLIDQYGIVPKEVAVKAIADCNIVCITGQEMKKKLSGYLLVLLEQNAKAVGGTLPADDFYYDAAE